VSFLSVSEFGLVDRRTDWEGGRKRYLVEPRGGPCGGAKSVREDGPDDKGVTDHLQLHELNRSLGDGQGGGIGGKRAECGWGRAPCGGGDV